MNPATAKMHAVTVVVPCYKVREYVADCIRSLFRQTLQEPFEIIVVDDCDPEHSLEEVRKIEAERPPHVRLRYMEHERNRGLSAARNTATAAATGEYVIYVDSDDELYPHALASLLSEARRTGADVAVGITRQEPPRNGKGIRTYCTGFYCGRAAFEAYMTCDIDMIGCNKLVRLAFLREHAIRFQEGLIHEDEVWNVDLLLAGASYVCPDIEPTYLYKLQRGGSIMAITELERLHLRINYCNINAAKLDAAGYADDPFVHHRLASVVDGAIVNIIRNAPHAGAWATWKMCRKLAGKLLTVSPAFLRHMRLGVEPLSRRIATLSALPGTPLRRAALTAYMLYLSKRIGPEPSV